MYNIYFRNRILTICEKDSPILKENDTILLHPSDNYKLSDVPYMMESNTSFKHLVITELGDIKKDEIFKRVFSKSQHINAAGGLISDGNGEYLMIYRNGVWDLPKGKQEPNENIIITAQREIKEECGVDCIPQNLICVTHHAYRINKVLYVKHTHWYKMVVNHNVNIQPQKEEGIERCVWCSREEVGYNLSNSYLSIREVFEKEGVV